MRVLVPDATCLRDTAPRIRSFRDALVTPFAQAGRSYRGAVYDAQGRLVPLSQRPQEVILKFTPADPARLPERPRAERMAGRGCYIGHLMSHYGHLITEGISALWAPAVARCDFLLAHPFIWGTEIPGYMADLLARFGVGPDRLRLVAGAVRVDELVVPERLWKINSAVNVEFRGLLDRVCGSERQARGTAQLYLSRTSLARRAVANEAEVEAVFCAHGFEVLSPQDHGLAAQLALYGRTRVIAGLAGSALHNVIFCPEGAGVISLGDARVDVTPNQIVCGALANGPTGVVPWSEEKGGIDTAKLAADLPGLLREMGMG